MAKEKFDFDAYQKWCEEKHLVASESASLEQYKAELEKVAQTSEKERKIAEQKEVFELVAKYMGKKVKYDERAYAFISEVFEGMLFAIDMVNTIEQSKNNVSKVLDKYGLGDENND